MIELLEKLINEHGSSAILKERLGLVAAEYEALERRASDLQLKTQAQESELHQLRAQVASLQTQLESFRSAHSKFVCDHCGSSSIVRVGSRPDPTFGDLGVKVAIYRCSSCSGETTVQQDGT